jgi:hypothetical protein
MENQVEETVVEQSDNIVVANDNAFSEESWAEQPVNTVQETKVEEKQPEAKQEEVKQEETKVEEVKTEAAPVVEVKEEVKPEPAAIEFANEDSKRIFELLKEGKESDVLDFLSRKSKIDKLATSEVNASTAEEIIKMGMQSKYADLTAEEIDYKFKKQFGIPKEPLQADIEGDEEFAERKAEWQQQVADIERERIIEAKLVKPELDKLKRELVLPNIERQSVSAEPTAEDIAKAAAFKESFIKSVDTTIGSFDGFKTTVKDEEVEIPLDYNLSAEQKTEVTTLMKELAEKDFNANAIFAQRWVNADNTLNTTQIAKDLSMVLYGEAANQSFSTNASAKRLAEYIKTKTNLKVDGTQKVFEPNDKNNVNQMADFFFSQ